LGLGVFLQFAGVGRLAEQRDQQVLFDQLRSDLANAVTPIGPTDYTGRVVRLGSPVALLEIPAIGVHQVVVEGTSSSVTATGPGHRRDSVMPGQVGSSVVFGRSGAYAAPFARLKDLHVGDAIRVTTGQGVQEFRVTALRRAGDADTGLVAGESRLTLVTADGPAFLPTGVLRVDAALGSPPQPVAPMVAAPPVTDAEKAMGADYSHTFALVLWLELLLVAAVLLTWSRARWGRWQTWLCGGPILAFLGVVVADHIAQLFPNLL
jgi:LPXTG-site transpeptidase (sortase) family protein